MYVQTKVCAFRKRMLWDFRLCTPTIPPNFDKNIRRLRDNDNNDNNDNNEKREREEDIVRSSVGVVCVRKRLRQRQSGGLTSVNVVITIIIVYLAANDGRGGDDRRKSIPQRSRRASA